MKNYIKSCVYNIDSGYVEVKFSKGAMMYIACTTVEDELAENMRQRTELDYLIYNKPVEYVKLILNGKMKDYLKL